MRFWLRIHFRRIFISNETAIPEKGPVLLACNHPNSFLDAVAIALLIKRPIHFLARSDVFRKPAARWILTKLHLIPIYRLQEGIDNIEKNKDTFRICSEILAQGKVLLIFSEGNCVLEKRLRALKKGSARIAFGAEDYSNWNLNIRIIPIGINYVQPTQFRTELMVSFGNGFSSNEWKTTWGGDPSKAIREFNERLAPALREELLIIPEKKSDDEAEAMLELRRSTFHYPVFRFRFESNKRLKLEQLLLKDQLPTIDSDEDRFQRFASATSNAGLTSRGSIPYVAKGSSLLILAGFIPAIAGFLIHLLPLMLARRIIQTTVRDPKFNSSVMFGTGALLTYIWYSVIAVILLIVDFRISPVVFIFPGLALSSVLWWELVRQRRNRFQFMIFRQKAPEAFKAWKHERDELLLQIHYRDEHVGQ